MDGIHDLGGMSGFGAIEVERAEPVFHERWEARVFGTMVAGAAVLSAYNADEYRHAVERIEPSRYLTSVYYERMMTAVATLLVEKGILTHAELEARAGGPFPLARPRATRAAGDVTTRSARFSTGDHVLVRDIHPSGHTRVPRYVRGKAGVVVFVAPPFSYPDSAAHGLPHREEPTCHVEFRASDLWTNAAGSNETVVVDLWSSYLEPAS